jgi:hypothetical protein
MLISTAALMLMISAYEHYTGGNIALAAIYVFAGVTGFSMLRNPKMSEARVQLYSGVTNAGLFAVQAVFLYQAGKKGLPFAWGLAAFFAGFSARKASKLVSVEEQAPPAEGSA